MGKMFQTDFLLASLLWSMVGTGCLIYGKKQGVAPALIAGLTLLSLSFFVQSALLLSALSLLCLTGMVWGIRRGF